MQCGKNIYYRSVRDLAIAIFKKKDLIRTYEALKDIYLTGDYDIPPEIIFNQPFSPKLLQILDQKTVAFYLSQLLIFMEYSLTPAQHIINHIFAGQPEKLSDPVHLTQDLTEHGLFDRALQILPPPDPKAVIFSRPWP